MRLRYSQQSTIAFSAFMDGWLGQMKTQVRENTMDGYRMPRKAYPTVFLYARGDDPSRPPGRWIFRILST